MSLNGKSYVIPILKIIMGVMVFYYIISDYVSSDLLYDSPRSVLRNSSNINICTISCQMYIKVRQPHSYVLFRFGNDI